MDGLKATRHLSWRQNFTLMMVWFLPVAFFALLGIARLLIPDVVLAAFFAVWLFGGMWASVRIHRNPLGATRHYVQDIDRVKGAYRVGWMMDVLHIPAVMLTVTGAILFAETYPSLTPRLLLMIVLILLYMGLIYRLWSRVSGFTVLDDGSLCIRRAGRDERVEVNAFQKVRAIPTPAGRGYTFIHRIQFAESLNGQAPFTLSLVSVYSRQHGTHVPPAVVEQFFTDHLTG